MIEVSDETLMAYADGALDPSERRRVDLYLQNSHEGPVRLEPFMATNSKALGHAFSALPFNDIPTRLVDAIYAAPLSQTSEQPKLAKYPAPVTSPSLWERVAGLMAPAFSLGSMATACATTLVLGGIAGWSLRSHQSTDVDTLIGLNNLAGRGLANVLETAPVKTMVKLDADGQELFVKPLLSFATGDQKFCRQYSVVTASQQQAAGLACRTRDGQWHVAAHAAVAKKAAGDGLSRPAGAAGAPVIDELADQMISGPALTPDAEAALIKNGWRN